MSSEARVRRLPVRNGIVTDSFWTNLQRVLAEQGLPHQWEQIESTGRAENFRRASRGESGTFGSPFYFDDSDLYKWLEAAAYVLMAIPSPKLREQTEEAIRLIQAAQRPDGYLNTYFQLQHPEETLQHFSFMHEMYCAGHLFEAGVSWKEALDDDRLLNVSIRFADLLWSKFGAEDSRVTCGHEEIELALLRLAKTTGDPKYATFARRLVERRGHQPSQFQHELETEPESEFMRARSLIEKDGRYNGEYFQDHLPVREHTDVVGHAVRAMYLYIAATELEGANEDAELLAALRATWDSITKRRMYITGGIGDSAANEGFTGDYILPNETAYAETCAAVGLVLWGNALYRLTGDAETWETAERALWNGALAGISEDTTRYFYDNVLESDGNKSRVPWFACSCCPPNIARLIGQIGNLVVTETDAGLDILSPVGLRFQTPWADGEIIAESTDPRRWRIRLTKVHQSPFEIRIRIPDWAAEVTFDAARVEEPADYDQGFAVLKAAWQAGDEIAVDFELEPRWMEAHPAVTANAGKVALEYGPWVYAVESHDNGDGLHQIVPDTAADVALIPESGFPANLTVAGYRTGQNFPDALYAPLGEADETSTLIHLRPYFRWNNRCPGQMRVWLRRG